MYRLHLYLVLVSMASQCTFATADDSLDWLSDNPDMNEDYWDSSPSLFDEVDNSGPATDHDLFDLNNYADTTQLTANPDVCLDGNAASRKMRRGINFCPDPTDLGQNEKSPSIPQETSTQEQIVNLYCPSTQFASLQIPVCSADATQIKPSEDFGMDFPPVQIAGLKFLFSSTLSKSCLPPPPPKKPSLLVFPPWSLPQALGDSKADRAENVSHSFKFG